MSPVCWSTWIMVVLLAMGVIYPGMILYRKLCDCFKKCKKTKTQSDTRMSTKGSEKIKHMEIGIPNVDSRKADI